MRIANDVLASYNTPGIVIDSNLLLLLFLGSFDRRQIGSNKRLAAYTNDDYDLLVRFLQPFSQLVTTPNILTEVSNLSNAVSDSRKREYFSAFANKLSSLDEKYIVSSTALSNPWARFGLTDATIAEVAKAGYLVLTDDFPLSQSLMSVGIDVINFNHLRDIYLR